MPKTSEEEKAQPRWKREPALWLIPLLFVLYSFLFIRLDALPVEELRIAGIDSVSYYAWSRSILFDRDLDFENEYRTLNPDTTLTAGTLVDPDGPRTETGHLPNVFAIGPGLLWTPFLAIAHIVASLGEATDDGYTLPYAVAVHIANALYGLLGALFLYLFLRKWFDASTATITATAAWTCTSALYYTFARETMAHACSFFAVALFLYTWSRARTLTPDSRRITLAWVAAGAALGLATLVRWQNAVFLLIPLVDLLLRKRERAIAPLAIIAAAATITFLPQLIAWRILFGTWLTIPQGESFMQWTRPDITALLFSRSHGLFLWTPVCIAAATGFLMPKKEWKTFLPAFAAVFLIQAYVSAAAGDPGWSFGARRLVNTIPLLAFGIAALLTRTRLKPKAAWTAVAALALWNFLFALQYMGYMDALYLADALTENYPAYNSSLQTEEQLKATLSTPGNPFDYEAFKAAHIFPRDAAPNWSQFFADKLTILFLMLV